MTLDLNKLEKKLDEVLENETPESLNAFLSSQKHHELFGFLGNGTVESLADEWSVNFEKSAMSVVEVEPTSVHFAADYDYGMAA